MKMALTAFVGGLFGFAMSRIGFTSWDLVHGMFTFTEFQLLLAFMMSVGVLTGAWLVIAKVSSRRQVYVPRGVHPGTIVGGALFGIGWALSGACPTIALSQLGEGKLVALYTIGGILVGNFIYSIVHERFFRWPASSCLDD